VLQVQLAHQSLVQQELLVQLVHQVAQLALQVLLVQREQQDRKVTPAFVVQQVLLVPRVQHQMFQDQLVL
jgi:hypothetical protein